MSIQRWTSWCSDPKREDENGRWVTYADHVAALRGCEARVRAEEHVPWHWQLGQQKFNDGLDAARDAVAAECIAHHGYTPGQTCPYCTDALAAIDGIREATP